MERKKILAIFLFCLIFLSDSVLSGETWVLEKEKNGIRCYTRVVKGSDFKEYKADVLVKTTYSALLALFEDLGNYPAWLDSASKGEIVRKVSTFEYYSYTVSDPPWPVSDRESVTLSRVKQDPVTGFIKITFKSVDGVKRNPDLVRVKLIDGYWKLMKENDSVRVVYKVHCDPGGSIPSSLVNAFIVSQPYNTLLNLKKVVQQERYQGVLYEAIKE